MSVAPRWGRSVPIPPPPSPPQPVDDAAAAGGQQPVALRVQGLRKRYGRHQVLAGIDLEIAAGSSVAVTGANGAGKSTLLNAIAGVSPPTAGRVDLRGARPGAGLRGSGGVLGVLSHATMLYDRLSGRENLELHARVRGLQRSRVDEVLAQVALSAAADRPVRAYSHGMRKRLSLARLLLHDPAVLILDEPFAGLDAVSCDRLADVIASLRGERTILFSTHDSARAQALADRLLVIDGGRVVADHVLRAAPVPAIEPQRVELEPSESRASELARFAGATMAMLRKDLLVEVRARTVTTAMMILAGLLAVVLGMAFEPLGADPAVLAGAIWVLITFAVMHGLSRSFDAEFHDDALTGLLLTGADPAALYLGKVISTTLLLLLVSLTAVGLISVFFAAPALLQVLPGLLTLMALASVGLTAVGGVVTVIARHSSLGETLLPLLFLPLVVPVLLAGIASVPLLLETGALDPGWLRVLIAYDVGMLVATTVLFEHLLEG